MRTVKEATWLMFHLLVAAFAVLLIASSIFPVRAQTATQVEITDLERRVGNFEALNLDHRLTAIETLLTSEDTWHRFSMGGTGLLICERVFWTFRRKREITVADNTESA